MKSLWLTCTMLCLGSLAGCSSATSATPTAERSDDDLDGRPLVHPEWALDDPTSPPVTVAMKIQPIPERDEESPPGENDIQPIIKPIPDDDQ